MEHSLEYTHTHTHDGVEHTHTHDHPHDHEHTHSHDHVHAAGEGDGKIVAVLSYMLEHNVHHCAELKEMAGGLSGEAQHQLLHAVEAFEEANTHLSKAVEELKQQEKE